MGSLPPGGGQGLAGWHVLSSWGPSRLGGAVPSCRPSHQAQGDRERLALFFRASDAVHKSVAAPLLRRHSGSPGFSGRQRPPAPSVCGSAQLLAWRPAGRHTCTAQNSFQQKQELGSALGPFGLRQRRPQSGCLMNHTSLVLVLLGAQRPKSRGQPVWFLAGALVTVRRRLPSQCVVAGAEGGAQGRQAEGWGGPGAWPSAISS